MKKVDLKAVKQSLQRLDEIARDNPEMINHSLASADEWLSVLKNTLEAEKMARTKKNEITHALNIRVNDELMKKIQAAADALKAQGLDLTMAAVVRHLIEKGLAENGGKNDNQG